MRKIILALAAAGALGGMTLPALAFDYDDEDRAYQYRYHHNNYYGRDYYYRPFWHRHYYDTDDYRWGYRHWWWKHHHYDPDRPWIRKRYY